MNTCPICQKEIKEGKNVCSVSCSNKYRKTSTETRNKIAESLKERSKNNKEIVEYSCSKCNKKFKKQKNKDKPHKDKNFCSRSCANSRTLSKETKDKIAKKLKIDKILEYKECKNCNFSFPLKRKYYKFCSRKCAIIFKNNLPENREISRITMLKNLSKLAKVKRSKNEKLFSELCGWYFNNVESNKGIFNGWDADVIIHDIKVAVLWNGIWHYKKITKNHSVQKVKNRDKIKINEIIKFGYIPYIIKDLGGFSINKVNEEFNKFLEYINTHLYPYAYTI